MSTHRSDAQKMFVGGRIRGLRADRALSQQALAGLLGISASYLNQIEHDNRPLTGPVLARITDVFGLDIDFFDPQDDVRLVAELREALLDEDIDIAQTARDGADLADFVATYQPIAEAMAAIHRQYRIATERLAAVTSGRGETLARGTITAPHEEVRNFFYQRRNYIHELDEAAETLTARMRMHSADLRAALASRLEERHGIRIVRRVDLGDNVLHRFDPNRKVMEFSAALSPGQRSMKIAAELGFLEHGELIDELVDAANYTSDDAVTLARLGLANYFAAAAVLPYSQFHGLAEDFRYDIERLSAFYAVSYETICHRLSTLQRPTMRGVPWTFVRVDRAGNMSKRQSATGFHFSSSGGTCPLWNVYETFGSPGKILTQITEMPDGREYFWVSRTVERRAARYGQPGKTFAIGMGCELRHAERVIYSDGLELGPDARATPIGAGCRVCDRQNCPQRAFPQLGVELHLEEHRSTVSPYTTS
ncbi:acetate metabolism transcriptional regulator RamB [Gordonia hydrophobica]|uniref:Acetate metabolism transcriptional regulator RamB n=1 Tax=Gordonia hydrophobica TaxID=40516 RepID=A0ABZ2U482_9ACTN|nr:acetate metabolism transcriptional regulator RamB [Gordonia hydrophobica]MBM7368008.1 putative transcriptional regulator/transcriptional regulator with XRE-family HTH domain [Gordonia hydrophobica]